MPPAVVDIIFGRQSDRRPITGPKGSREALWEPSEPFFQPITVASETFTATEWEYCSVTQIGAIVGKISAILGFNELRISALLHRQPVGRLKHLKRVRNRNLPTGKRIDRNLPNGLGGDDCHTVV